MNRRRSRRRRRYDLDLLDLLGAQRAQVGEQLLGLHAQFAVVDIDLRARLAVYRDLLVVDPNARCAFQQLDAVLADRRRGVGHVDHEAVGLAADELRLDHHAFDPGRRAFSSRSRPGRCSPRPAPAARRGRTRGIVPTGYTRPKALSARSGPCRRWPCPPPGRCLSAARPWRTPRPVPVRPPRGPRPDRCGLRMRLRRPAQYYDEEDKFFHTILSLFVICTAF